MDRHAEPAGAGGRDAHQVRLGRTGHQHRVRAPGLGRAELELELAHLVAAERKPRAVLALHSEQSHGVDQASFEAGIRLQVFALLGASDDIGVAPDPLGVGQDLERWRVERDRLGAGLRVD